MKALILILLTLALAPAWAQTVTLETTPAIYTTPAPPGIDFQEVAISIASLLVSLVFTFVKGTEYWDRLARIRENKIVKYLEIGVATAYEEYVREEKLGGKLNPNQAASARSFAKTAAEGAAAQAGDTGLIATIPAAEANARIEQVLRTVKAEAAVGKAIELPEPIVVPGDYVPPAKVLGLLLCAGLALSGCLTLPPGLGGKTKYSMHFKDTVSEIKDEAGVVVAPGQDTEFGVTIAAQEGVEITDLASMTYIVNPDTGQVEIRVASDTSADTTVQAQAMVQAHQATLETIKVLTPAITDAITDAIVPLSTSPRTPPPPRRRVNMPRLLEGLQSIGVEITNEQAELLVDLLGMDVVE